MKNALKTVLAWTALFTFCVGVAVAQDSIFSISIGGSRQNISVVNGTTDGTRIVAIIDRHQSSVLRQGESFERSVGAFSNRQEVLIQIDVCSNVEMVYRFESAPAWPDNINQPEGLPITDGWLRSRPDKDAIKRRVDDVTRFMKKQPGGKDYVAQLKAWKDLVENHGIAPKGQLCEAPQVIQALTFNRVMWGSYGNLETALTLVGSDGRYSIQNPPRWVY